MNYEAFILRCSQNIKDRYSFHRTNMSVKVVFRCVLHAKAELFLARSCCDVSEDVVFFPCVLVVGK